jgi:putative ABC transport system ATP-binding protein
MLRAIGVTKVFGDTRVLHDVSISVEKGEFACVAGRSGSGKSTLLNVLSTLLRPDSGEIYFQNQEVTRMDERHIDNLRHSAFSMVFQQHHLLPYLTVLENVLLPFMDSLAPVDHTQREKAGVWLERVELSGKEDRLPGDLSGGEQQRVAIARALVKKPAVLFADEPTGSLDKHNGDIIIELLRNVNRDGVTLVMVTHEASYAKYADKLVVMEDGRIEAH